MSNYFIFNGKDSRDFEIQLSEYPPIVSPVERIETITVPGRSGTLHMREGEGVYDSYTKNFEIVALNPERIPEIKKWLRGRGELIVGNELDYIYDGYINAETEFTRFFRGWRKATIPIEVQPFKFSRKKKRVYFGGAATEFDINAGNASDMAIEFVVERPKITGLKSAKFTVILNGVEVTWVEYAALNLIASQSSDSETEDENNYCIKTTANIKDLETEGEAVINGVRKSYVGSQISYKTTPLLKKGRNTVQFVYTSEADAVFIEYSEVRL